VYIALDAVKTIKGRKFYTKGVGSFEKVSYEQFEEALENAIGNTMSGEFKQEFFRNAYENLRLPERATTGSAGYDFWAPYGFNLAPGESIKIPTGIRVAIDDGWWLGCLPRSGHGFKYKVQLDNTLGVIDSDYYFSDNEGHIFAKLTNDCRENKTLHIKAGEGYIQGIFLPYGTVYGDSANGVRNGGMGSTTVVTDETITIGK